MRLSQSGDRKIHRQFFGSFLELKPRVCMTLRRVKGGGRRQGLDVPTLFSLANLRSGGLIRFEIHEWSNASKKMLATAGYETSEGTSSVRITSGRGAEDMAL